MKPFDKEQVYEQLRNYHIDKLPDIIADSEVGNLKDRFTTMEDKVITMILRFANNQESYLDLSNEVENFRTRLDSISTTNERIKNLINLRIDNLLRIMYLARDSGAAI